MQKLFAVSFLSFLMACGQIHSGGRNNGTKTNDSSLQEEEVTPDI